MWLKEIIWIERYKSKIETKHNVTSEEIEMKVDIQKRHYLIEVEMNTAEMLQESARKKGIPVSLLANELLQKQLAEAE